MRFLRFLRRLKGFWPLSILLWLLGLAACVGILPLLTQDSELVFIAMALVTAFWLLVVVLRQYHRIRAERNIENLVELEVRREVAGTEAGDYQILSERLKHAMAMQRAARAVDGGKASLYELPWYLVIGMAASGKTSLLTRSSLSATIAGGSSLSGISGTQHCDWYFSREAVMIDTAGRYLVEDQPANEFSEFLKTLRKQRSKPAINGLVLVVSLPELLEQSRQEMQALAEKLVARVDEYRRCLGVNPPLYLFFSKTDLLPGFARAFETLSQSEREQPWGLTFSLDELRKHGVTSAFQERFPGLVSVLRDRVDQRVLDEGADADSDLLRFPDYFAELFGVLSDFLEQFDAQKNSERAPILRGLYFTSALQTGHSLPGLLDEQTRDDFALASAPVSTSEPRVSERSYFITNAFRQVIFPDRNLSLYYSKQGDQRSWQNYAIGSMGVLALAIIASQSWSAFNNKQWIERIQSQVDALAASNAAESLDLQKRQALLDHFQQQLTLIESHHEKGQPVDLGLGLYQGEALESSLKEAWAGLFQRDVLTPLSRHLSWQLKSLKRFGLSDQNPAGATPDDEGSLAAADDSLGSAAQTLSDQGREVSQDSVERLAERATARPSMGSVPTSGSALKSQLGSELRSRTTDSARGAWYSARSGVETSLEEGLRDRVRLLGESGTDAEDGQQRLKLSGERAPSLSEQRLTELSREDVEKLIESYSSLKLYLILTEPDLHKDQGDFIASVLPRLWEDRLGLGVSRESVAANVALYVHYLQQGRAPALIQDETLVAESREQLNTFLIDSTLVDREYLRYQLEVEERFEPLTLSKMVPEMRGRLLYSSRSVPAFYTRQVWDEYLRSAIIETISGDLQEESDWVLNDSTGDDAVRTKARFVRQLMARYKHDYAVAWERFLSHTYVGDFSDLQQASYRLARLSDLQHSPLRKVLEAVELNTTWDNPVSRTLASEAGSDGDGGFWARVTSVFERNGGSAASFNLSSLPRINDGLLTDHFNPVARLLVADDTTGNGDSVLNQYLLNLRQLKVRIDNVRNARDAGRSSKALIVSTLAGESNEINTLRNFVASRIDTSNTPLVKAFEPLFSVPVDNTRKVLNDPARQQLNVAWDDKVIKPWGQMIAGRYPVADSVNEASVRDMEYFIDPDDGVMSRFRREEIGDLVAPGGKPDPSMVDPRMLSSIEKATLLGKVIDSLSDLRNGFELQINPTAGLTDIILTIDGQRLHYRNNTQSWERLNWPGDGKAFGARLDIINSQGQRHTVFDYPNRWGFLRMIQSAQIIGIDNARQNLSWHTAMGVVSFDVRNFGGVKVSDLQRATSLRLPTMGGGKVGDLVSQGKQP